MLQALEVAFSLTAANFIYQAFSTRLWGTALERSFFQVMAILIYYFYHIRP